MGSLTKKIQEGNVILSTPQSLPQSSKTCGQVYTVDHDVTTPTLPQGAAAARQRQLTKTDVRQNFILM